MTTPQTMVREAQVNLAFLFRFADRMASASEGVAYRCDNNGKLVRA